MMTFGSYEVDPSLTQSIGSEEESTCRKSSEKATLSHHRHSRKPTLSISSITSKASSSASRQAFSEESSSCLPIVACGDIQAGKLIGCGSFCNILEAKVNKKTSKALKTNRSKRFVIKKVNEDTASPKLFARNVEDLKREGQILASLNHRVDIVSICAWTFQETGHTEEPEQSYPFLLLERLDETLRSKLLHWRENIGYYGSMRKNIVSTRCKIVVDLAEVLRYVHSRRIIHRDLKPCNIGFQRGQLKLFDFGIARVLTPKTTGEDYKHDDTFHLTGKVGTIRYMSPECGRNQPYNCKSDVYSFGLLCYEVLSLQKPYADILASQDAHKAAVELVWKQGLRPSLAEKSSSWLQWPEPLSKTIQKCWHKDIAKRPTMEEAHAELSESLPLLWKRGQPRVTFW